MSSIPTTFLSSRCNGKKISIEASDTYKGINFKPNNPYSLLGWASYFAKILGLPINEQKNPK